MNLSRHAMERYCLRILGLTDKNEINTYISKNNQDIETSIRNIFNESELIYVGKVGGDMSVCRFYLNEDICLVLSTDGKDVLKTMYKIKFSLPEEMQKPILESLTKHLYQCDLDINSKKDEIQTQINELDLKLQDLTLQMSYFEEQIKNIRAKKDCIEQEKRVLSESIQPLVSQQDIYAFQLFGQYDLKLDLKEGRVR